MLLGRLYRTGFRRSEYDDEKFAEIYKRRKYARDFSRNVTQNERAKGIDYENQVLFTHAYSPTLCAFFCANGLDTFEINSYLFHLWCTEYAATSDGHHCRL